MAMNNLAVEMKVAWIMGRFLSVIICAIAVWRLRSR